VVHVLQPSVYHCPLDIHLTWDFQEGIAWWDELHRKALVVILGREDGCGYLSRVQIDDNGYPAIAGKLSENSPVNVKYKKDVHFTLGVILVLCTYGTNEGHRVPMIDYKEKIIVMQNTSLLGMQ